MHYKDYSALVKRFGGWIERGACDEFTARFPSVWHREQFERALAEVKT